MEKFPLNSRPQLPKEVGCQGSNHILHLYTPVVDKYAIHRGFLMSSRNGKGTVYATSCDDASIIRELEPIDGKLKIIKPNEVRELGKLEKCDLSVIIDAGSILGQKDRDVDEREAFLNELCEKHGSSCLCTYDVTKLSPERIQQLAGYHAQLRLTTSDLTILSGYPLEQSKLSDDALKKMVKDNLETILLALLHRKTMCGTEIIGTIHLKFHVLLSPGTIYPLLHSLDERGLITAKSYGKEKAYASVDSAKTKIERLVDEQIQARKLLTHYLRQEISK
jgi:DNA-binding PadR family transcriptional regulator